MGKANKQGAAPAGAAASPAAEQGAEHGDEGNSIETLVAQALGVLPEPPEGGTDEADDEGDELSPEGEESENAEESDSADDENDSDSDEEEAEGSEETEEEGEPESEEDTEGAEEGAEEEEAGRPSPALQKRFNKLSAQNRELRTRLAAAEARVARPAQPLSSIEAEVAAATSLEDIAALEEKLARLEDWATAHAGGLELPAEREGGEPRTLTPQHMQQTLLNARRGQRLLAKQAEVVKATEAQRQQFDAYAAEQWPDYEDEGSELSVTYANVIRAVPELRRLPNLRVIVADAVAGQKLRQEKLKQAKAATAKPGKPVAKPAKPPTAMPAAAARKPASDSVATSKKQKQAAALKRAEQTGSEEDIALAIEAGL